MAERRWKSHSENNEQVGGRAPAKVPTAGEREVTREMRGKWVVWEIWVQTFVYLYIKICFLIFLIFFLPFY